MIFKNPKLSLSLHYSTGNRPGASLARVDPRRSRSGNGSVTIWSRSGPGTRSTKSTTFFDFCPGYQFSGSLYLLLLLLLESLKKSGTFGTFGTSRMIPTKSRYQKRKNRKPKLVLLVPGFADGEQVWYRRWYKPFADGEQRGAPVPEVPKVPKLVPAPRRPSVRSQRSG